MAAQRQEDSQAFKRRTSEMEGGLSRTCQSQSQPSRYIYIYISFSFFFLPFPHFSFFLSSLSPLPLAPGWETASNKDKCKSADLKWQWRRRGERGRLERTRREGLVSARRSIQGLQPRGEARRGAAPASADG